jgi:D-xylose transport system permease protein
MSSNTPVEPKAQAAAAEAPWKQMLGKINLQIFVILAAIIVIALFFSFMTDWRYLTPRNISNLFRQTAITGVLALGMIFVIISGEIDLSVGSLMGLLGGVAAILDVWYDFPLPLTIVTTLFLGLICGLWNGWWVAYRKVPSFIVTLAGLLAFRGVLVHATGGTTISPISEPLNSISSYLDAGTAYTIGVVGLALYMVFRVRARVNKLKLGVPAPTLPVELLTIAAVIAFTLGGIALLNVYRGVPLPVLIMVALMLICWFIARKTTFGRRVYAIGGNIEAARLTGINVERAKMAVFALNGLMVAVAGLILVSRLNAGSPSAGQSAEMDAIAACVIGGASLMGGIGKVPAVISGALIMAMLDNGMTQMNIQVEYQYIVKGLILLLAVWADSATKQRQL